MGLGKEIREMVGERKKEEERGSMRRDASFQADETDSQELLSIVFSNPIMLAIMGCKNLCRDILCSRKHLQSVYSFAVVQMICPEIIDVPFLLSSF